MISKRVFAILAVSALALCASPAWATAVAITPGASAQAGTDGASAGAQAESDRARNVGAYNNGMATFTIVKRGATYQVADSGQKFKYKPGSKAQAAASVK
mgnify:CR=1 FL=1